MSKKFVNNIKKLFAGLSAFIFGLGNFVYINPKAISSDNVGIEATVLNKDEKTNESINEKLKKNLDDVKYEIKEEKVQVEGNWRKIGRFLGRRGFYFLLGMIAPHLNLSQSDLVYAESLTVGYIMWKFSGDVCSLVGLKDKKTREYTLKNICKKAANLLIRLGSMVAMNKYVPKNILRDCSMGYISDGIDIVCEDMTPEDRQNIKNIANRGITLSEGGIRYCCFSYLAKFIPKLLAC